MFTLRSQIVQKILGYLFIHEEGKMYVNEMARRFGLDSGNLTRKLAELEKEGILKSEWQGNQRYYSLNPQFPFYQEYKQITQKTIGFEHQLKETLRGLKGIEEAYIFGSYARDQMDQHSDIDVLVIGDHSTIELQKRISKLQKETDRLVNCISMSKEEYEKGIKKGSFLKNIKKARIKIV